MVVSQFFICLTIGYENESVTIDSFSVRIYFKGNEYWAANSCLQLGYIYQKLNFKQLDKTHFNKVFEYKNYDYKNYLQQQAKAALAKL